MKILDYSLLRNTALEELNLSNCGIDDNCLKMICPSLIKNQTLLSLHLFNNPITDEGAYFILSALLSFNQTIKAITLYGTQIDQEDNEQLQKIKELLRYNQKGMKRLDPEQRDLQIAKIFENEF